MTHSKEWTSYSLERTSYSKEWMTHSTERMSYSPEWTIPAKERMSYSTERTTDSGEGITRSPDGRSVERRPLHACCGSDRGRVTNQTPGGMHEHSAGRRYIKDRFVVGSKAFAIGRGRSGLERSLSLC
jgi:hypothetical protein